jgi:hypothetical protein
VTAGPAVENDMTHTRRLSPPRHDNTVLTIGWILTTVGILCTVASLLLMIALTVKAWGAAGLFRA